MIDDFMMECLEIMAEGKCVICGRKHSHRVFTCSEECHEKFVEELIDRYGEFKKIVVDGVAYKVPTVDIIEKGVKGWEVPEKYEVWK